MKGFEELKLQTPEPPKPLDFGGDSTPKNDYDDYDKAERAKFEASIVAKKPGELLSVEEAHFARLRDLYWKSGDQPR